MAKPASGTALNTGHALYTSLTAVWAMLEGSGGTTADSKGTNTGTLNAQATWSTDADGAIIACAGIDSQRITLGSRITFDGSASWSIAWRGKQTTSDTSGMILGDYSGTTDFLWFNGGSALRLRNTSSADYDFTGVTVFTTAANYVLTFNQSTGDLKLYKDGSLVATIGSVTGTLKISALGAGFFGAFTLVGSLNYVYVWSGRVIDLTEAGTLHSDPYTIFGAAATGSKRRLTRLTMGIG